MAQFRVAQPRARRAAFKRANPQEYKEVLRAADAEVSNVLKVLEQSAPKDTGTSKASIKRAVDAHTKDVLAGLLPILFKIATAGAIEGARKAKIGLIKAAEINSVFDIIRPETLNIELAKQIGNISFAQADTIEKLIQASIKHGIAPKDIAKVIDIALLAPDAAVLGLADKIGGLPVGTTDLNQLQRTLETSLSKQATKHAMTIARTETMTAANHGQQTFWQKAQDEGLIKESQKVMWIVTPDDRLDEVICEPMSGKTKPLGGQFKMPDGELLDSPPAHPNCRCTTGLV